MHARRSKSTGWTRSSVGSLAAVLILASGCKPAEPPNGPQVGAAQVLAPTAGPVAPGPGQVAAAGLPGAPSAAAAPAAPIAAAPVELVPGKPPFEMPDWYAPLFVVGNRWRYSSHVSSSEVVYDDLEEGHGQMVSENSDHTSECRTSGVVVLGQEALAKIDCVGSGKVSNQLSWTYLAGPKGLYRDPTVKNSIVRERGTLVLKNPVAPFHVGLDAHGGVEDSIAMKWAQGPVAGKPSAKMAESTKTVGAFGPEGHETVMLAQGLGIARVDFGEQGESSRSEVHELQEFIPTMVPASLPPGQLSLGSEGERLAKFGLRCADQVGLGLAAGEPGQPIRISPGGWADVSSDVRPGVAALRGKILKCSMTIETRNSNVSRLGSFWTGKPGELAALQAQLGAPLEKVELTQGSSATAWKVNEGILVVYQPTTRKPEYEWWIYDVAQWTAGEKAIWQAYAFNDAAMELADSKDPLQLAQAAVGLREATKLVPTYSKAWLRLCKVAQKIGKPTKDFVEAKAACEKAQQSAFGDVRKEAGKLLKGMGN